MCCQQLLFSLTLQRVKNLCKPEDSWGPALPENRKRYLADLDPSELDVCVSMNEKISPHKGTRVCDEATVIFLPKAQTSNTSDKYPSLAFE